MKLDITSESIKIGTSTSKHQITIRFPIWARRITRIRGYGIARAYEFPFSVYPIAFECAVSDSIRKFVALPHLGIYHGSPLEKRLFDTNTVYFDELIDVQIIENHIDFYVSAAEAHAVPPIVFMILTVEG